MLNYREVEEKIKKLEKENIALKNRCYATTQGMMCPYCKFECSGHAGKMNKENDNEG